MNPGNTSDTLPIASNSGRISEVTLQALNKDSLKKISGLPPPIDTVLLCYGWSLHLIPSEKEPNHDWSKCHIFSMSLWYPTILSQPICIKYFYKCRHFLKCILFHGLKQGCQTCAGSSPQRWVIWPTAFALTTTAVGDLPMAAAKCLQSQASFHNVSGAPALLL